MDRECFIRVNQQPLEDPTPEQQIIRVIDIFHCNQGVPGESLLTPSSPPYTAFTMADFKAEILQVEESSGEYAVKMVCEHGADVGAGVGAGAGLGVGVGVGVGGTKTSFYIANPQKEQDYCMFHMYLQESVQKAMAMLKDSSAPEQSMSLKPGLYRYFILYQSYFAVINSISLTCDIKLILN